MKKVGVLLSGCGVYDGAEIQEAVLSLLYIAKNRAQAICMAPDNYQADVANHITGTTDDGNKRNILAESARICRGEITDIKAIDPGQLDALIIPGGFGAAKNLSDFAFSGPEATVNPEVEKLLEAMHGQKKPIGVLCIAPVVAAAVLGGHEPVLTIGNDSGTASALVSMGARHEDSKPQDIVVDEKNRIVSTPAYMLGLNIVEVAVGIEKLVKKVLEMAD